MKDKLKMKIKEGSIRLEQSNLEPQTRGTMDDLSFSGLSMYGAAKESQQLTEHEELGSTSSEDEKEETADFKQIGEGMIKSTSGNMHNYSIEMDEVRKLLRFQATRNFHSIELPLA